MYTLLTIEGDDVGEDGMTLGAYEGTRVGYTVGLDGCNVGLPGVGLLVGIDEGESGRQHTTELGGGQLLSRFGAVMSVAGQGSNEHVPVAEGYEIVG